jgi:hypothetical protein
MITAGEGGVDWRGAASGGIGGTRSTGALVVAAAKPAALTADKAPVTATTPETPPMVHDVTRLNALSRSSGRYDATQLSPPPPQLSSHPGVGEAAAVGLGVAVAVGPTAE